MTPLAVSSPIPPPSETLNDLGLPKDPEVNLRLQSAYTVPTMSITPASPLNPPSTSLIPERSSKTELTRQRSSPKLNSNATGSNREDKPTFMPSSIGGGVWGSLVNAASKVTDTLSSLAAPSNSPTPHMNRSTNGTPVDEGNGNNNLSRPRSRTMPSSNMLIHSSDIEQADPPKKMAIDTLGEGELSLRQLGFESESPNHSTSPSESPARPASVQDEIQDGGKEDHFSVMPIKAPTLDSSELTEHKRNESMGRSRRSLTVPTRGDEVLNGNDRRSPTSGFKKPRRLSSLSKGSLIRRNESVTSHGSSEATPGDDVNRRSRKRSSLITADEGVDSPQSKAVEPVDASEDRENEDGLYIHGKDGKKRRVPVTGFAVQSGKRNRDFHALFKSVEETDYLIEGRALKICC